MPKLTLSVQINFDVSREYAEDEVPEPSAVAEEAHEILEVGMSIVHKTLESGYEVSNVRLTSVPSY
jgi:hypothetical protein